MPRRRNLSTTISVDKTVNRVATEHGDWVALVFTWLIPHAGDDTYLPTDDAEELLMTVFPGRRDRTVEDMQRAIDVLVDEKLLVRDNGLHFKAESFYAYQSRIPENRRCGVGDSAAEAIDQNEDEDSGTNAAEGRESAQCGTNAAEGRERPLNSSSSSSLSSSTSGVKKRASRGRTSVDYSSEFEAMWQIYPRRIDKAKAWRAWQARLREGHTGDEMLAAVTRYAKAVQGKDAQYVKHAATFFGPDRPFLEWSRDAPPGAGGSQSTMDQIARWANGGST